jgi:hypothetical protein
MMKISIAVLSGMALAYAPISHADQNLAVSTLSATSSVSSPSVQTTLQGWPDQPGTYWQSQFHANWNVVQSRIVDNPTEWQIYTHGAQGIARTQAGTDQVVLQGGTPFNPSWRGLPFFYLDGKRYRVASVLDPSHLSVQTVAGAPVNFAATEDETYYFVTTSTASTVNVNGTSVTYVSGQPFTSIYDNGVVYINGAVYPATFRSPTSLTLGVDVGTLTNASLQQYANINDELATLRLQGLMGADEENVALTFRPDGAWLQTLYAGRGRYRPMFLSVGENPMGTMSPLLSLYPNASIGRPGTLSLGGNIANQAVRIDQNSDNVNYLYQQGGPKGFSPSIAARGGDASVGLAFDVQGASTTSFTSHAFANVEFQVFGVGGTSWLAVASSASAAPTLSANGAAGDIDVVLAPKGAGRVVARGGVRLPMTTVAALPACNDASKGLMYAVSDAASPAYDGTLTPGGATSVPAYCNGANWTAH